MSKMTLYIYQNVNITFSKPTEFGRFRVINYKGVIHMSTMTTYDFLGILVPVAPLLVMLILGILDTD